MDIAQERLDRMIVYGTKQCPDTTVCLESLEKAGTPYEFRDISDLSMLKEFLSYRDHSPLFDPVRAAGGVGIPFLVLEDGTQTFEWSSLG